MKKLFLISALLLVASNGWAYNETDLAKFKALNACEGCDLSGANLQGTGNDVLEFRRFSGANLRGANLSFADLRGANLSFADLTDADLTRANLTGAKLTGVNLCNANLTTTILGFNNSNLPGAKFCKT